jgi:hypothetical protein
MPRILRACAFALMIIGGLFKIQHWPWSVQLFLLAWCCIVVSAIWRLAVSKNYASSETARDVFIFGLVSTAVMRQLHLPGRGFALAMTLIGGAAVVWYERGRFLPTGTDAKVYPSLFYSSVVLILVGALLQILHWPYGSVLILVGLLLAGYWFVVSKEADA